MPRKLDKHKKRIRQANRSDARKAEMKERSTRPSRNKLIIEWNPEKMQPFDKLHRQGFNCNTEKKARKVVARRPVKNMLKAVYFDKFGKEIDVLMPEIIETANK
jgi:hypothetical protein